MPPFEPFTVLNMKDTPTQLGIVQPLRRMRLLALQSAPPGLDTSVHLKP